MADRIGQQLGLYRLTRLVGKGAFAEVYLAEHVRLLTQAAVKVLQAQLEREEEERFQEEARMLARLTHPHIIHLEDFAVHDGTPFLVMDYAPNGTLRQKFPKGVAQPPGEILPYVWQVAEALQFAHGLQVIHRDVKPENMLLDANNEVLLSDFGIAVVSQNSRYKAAQEAIGTATYMAPEQVRARAVPASDQYSLAVLVYEWLCGAPPFQGSMTEVMAKHLFAEPQRMRERVRTVSPAVEAVILGALSKDPEDRFPSVVKFAEAFDQACQAVPMLLFAAPNVVAPVEAGEPSAEPPPAFTPAPPSAPAEPEPPAEPPAQPEPAPAAPVTVRRGRFASVAPLPRADAPAAPEPQVMPEGVTATPSPLPSAEPPAMPEPFAPASSPTPPPDAPPRQPFTSGPLPMPPAGAPEPPMMRQRSGPMRPVPNVQKMIDQLPDPPVSLQQAAPPPVGPAAGGAMPMPPAGPPHRPGEPPAWGQPPMRPPAAGGEPPPMPIAPVRPPPDYQGASIVLSAPAGPPPATQPPPAAALLPSFSNQPGAGAPPAGGAPLAGESQTAQARQSLGPTWREVNWIPTPASPIHAPPPAQPPEMPSQGLSRRTLLIGGLAGVVVVGGLAWLGINELTRPGPTTGSRTGVTPSPASPTPIPAGTTLFTYSGHKGFLRGLAWSPDGSRIASASDDQTVQVWGALNGSQPLTYSEHSREVISVAWSPDGQYIASGSRDLSLHVWNATTGEKLHEFGFNGRVIAVAWSPDGKHLAAGSWDATVQIWDTATWQRIHKFTASGEVNTLSWSPDNTHLVTGDNAHQAVIWNGIEGGRILTYHGHSSTILSVAWSPDGATIVSGADADDTTVQCWDSATGDNIWKVLVPDETPALEWSVKGDKLAAGGASATLLDPKTGSQVFSYPGNTWALVWSPDGKYIASGGQATTVQVWKAP